MSNNTTITTQTYRGTFVKVNGQKRSMRFVRIPDLPAGMISESAHQHIRHLQGLHGSEVVYDLDKQGFRSYNWKTSSDSSNAEETVSISI
jgi:hypothetical protein